jgi:hypothetical protein
MYLASTNVGHPTLRSWKYPLPGDKDIPMISRCVINVDDAKVIMFNIPPDPHRASLSDDISSSGTFDDIDWNPMGLKLLFFLLQEIISRKSFALQMQQQEKFVKCLKK